MSYQEKIRNLVQELYDTTEAFATSRHYTFSYWWIESNFGLDLNDKKIRDDVWEMSYSDGFCDLIQAMDFDDDNKRVTLMMWKSNNKKKYTIDTYKEFCDNALVTPPIEEFDNGTIDENKWWKEHRIRIAVGNHEIELDYCADNVNEIEYALKEMYEVEMDMRNATTGNTVKAEVEKIIDSNIEWFWNNDPMLEYETNTEKLWLAFREWCIQNCKEVCKGLTESFIEQEVDDKYSSWMHMRNIMEKKKFVAQLSKTLNMAKPHLTCEYKLGEEIGKGKGDEYVVVTASNGYQYFVCVTANSLAAIAEEVFRAMICK